LRRAAKPMAGAAAALLDADGSAARELQREAVSLLSRLLNEIHQAAEAARRDAQRQKAALIRAKLEALRGRQLEINQQTEALVNVVAQTGRLGRLERRKVSVLKHEQDDVWSGSSALQTELEDAVVYRFVLGRVLEGMSSSATAFGERRVDRLLRETQDRVIADLDVLLAALRDIFELKPPDEFADGGGGQPNGGNAVQKQQSVPALAELLVLKSMQLSLNQRTAAAAKDYNAETATEAQLSEVRALADEQQMIESLTRQVIKEAAKRER
jgi:hypothetical protein